MNARPTNGPPADLPLWAFIELEDYALPQPPATETVRRGLGALFARLRASREPEAPIFQPEELDVVPPALLDRAATAPTWQGAFAALHAPLEQWLGADIKTFPVQVVVGAPYSGVPLALTDYAQTQGWRIVEPPSTAQILSGDPALLTSLLDVDARPALIPRLEQWYLRHYNGLKLIRGLINHIASGEQRYLVGCDSWAWAYLSRGIHIDSLFPPPLTLAPFNQERLAVWFSALSTADDGPPGLFLDADDGHPVIADPRPAETDPAHGGDGAGPPLPATNFLQYVAAWARGIPGVAHSVWRASLRLPLEDESTPKADEAGRLRFLVKPWRRLSLPRLPDRVSNDDLFLLHTLLLHGGVATDLLPELLPSQLYEIHPRLQRLRIRGFIEHEEGMWQVAALGYPAVREVLQAEGYLVDAI